jgi:DNA polymerase/3'-5' exonuclease PolX
MLPKGVQPLSNPATKTRAKKKVSAKKTSAKKSAKSAKNDTSETVTLHGIPIHEFNPLHPKSKGIELRVKKATDAAMLSAQAAASPFKDDLAQRIPRAEQAEHIRLITSIAPTAMPAGSYRRGAPTSSDIDIVLREPIPEIVDKLTKIGYIIHTFASGARKFSGIVKHPRFPRFRHLDLVMTTPRCYPFAMLYFTGPARFNIVMRVKAKRKGLKLNEYGLFKDDQPLPGITTERDIFAALGIEYKEPKDR